MRFRRQLLSKFSHSFYISIFLSLILSSCVKSKKKENSKTSSIKNIKILNVARGADPRTLDPQAQFDQGSNSFVSNVYDTLLDYHYLKRPYELVPSLLEKMPDVSKDGKTYTFNLKKGIYFLEDTCFGEKKKRELTASDVLYTIKRFSDVRINNLSWFLLDGIVEGLDDFREKTTKDPKFTKDYEKVAVSGLKELGRHSFEIKLTKKNKLFMYALATSSLSIVPKEAVSHYGRNFGRHPVGTGPFRLKEYEKKQKMILIKNPNYFLSYPSENGSDDKLLSDKNKKLPLIDEVHVHFIPEAQPAMLKFKKGRLSWVGLDRDNFMQMAYRDAKGEFHLKGKAAKDYVLYTEPGLSFFYYVFNMKDSLLGKNKNLRKAIAYAIDVNAKIKLLQNGRGEKLYTVVPQAIKGSEKDIGKFWYDYDLAKAKDYLKQAGFPEGKGLPVIEMTLSGTSSATKKQFEFIRSSLSQIGVKLKGDFKTWPSYLKTLDSGDYQFATAGWAADYPDAENFYQLFYGGNIPGSNHGYFNNESYNKLYEKIRFMPDGEERFKLFREMAQILKDEVPIVLDSTPLVSGLLQKSLRNFKRHMMLPAPYKYINLAQK